MSADGSMLAGMFNYEAALFDAGGNPQLLLDVLLAQGATGLSGWQLLDAYAMSADGLWIAGTGINPQGHGEAFLAGISAVPLPGGLWLALPAFGLLAPRLRKRRA